MKDHTGSNYVRKDVSRRCMVWSDSWCKLPGCVATLMGLADTRPTLTRHIVHNCAVCL